MDLTNKDLEKASEEQLLEMVDRNRVPRHVAIIMDGNGRWARQRRLGRIFGHRQGAEAVRNAVKACRELDIAYLTLYAFSSENWSRPQDEIAALMELLEDFLRKEKQEMIDEGIQLNAIGRVEELPQSTQEEISRTKEATKGGKKLLLTLALSYSGRIEILDAVKRLLVSGTTPDAIDEEVFRKELSTNGIPDPDLLVRTSGEMRVSNFLLWQIAYSEIYITPVLWPDFTQADLYRAVIDYQNRERRFGGLGND